MHMADLHFYKNYPLKKLKKIEDKIKQKLVDYICITGDLLDTPEITKSMEIYYFLNFFRNLSLYAKVIVCLGNHDMLEESFKEYNDFLENLKNITNLHLLRNEKIVFDSVCFFSYEQPKAYFEKEKQYCKKIIRDFKNKNLELDVNNYNIALIHSPLAFIENRKTLDMDLILSGHTHDGLLFPPITKINNIHFGIVSPNKELFQKNVRGIYYDFPSMIITGGIIKLSKTAHLFHYFNILYPSSMNLIEISQKR